MIEINLPSLGNELLSPIEQKKLDIENLTSERQKLLEDYHLKEDEEKKLMQVLENLRRERNEIEIAGRKVANQIVYAKDDLAELERLEKEKTKLAEEANFLQDAENMILEIMKQFESYDAAHDYQKTDILFIVAAYLKGKTGFLNANDMGLGKTYEGIVSLFIISRLFEDEFGRKPNILWLTKKSLMKTTPKEINKWWKDARIQVPLNATTKKDRETQLEFFNILQPTMFLCNYEFVRTTPAISEMEWDLIVVDEVHKLKGGANPGGPTAIWAACKELCLKARFNLFLSGTPMVNRPEEMWSYLHVFSPSKFPDVKTFQKNFMQYKEMAGEFKLEIQAKRLLENVLKGQMIARSRYDEDVKIQLPDVTYEEVMLEMNEDQRKAYDMMRDQFFIWLDGQETPLTAAAIIAQLTRLRQINSQPHNMKYKAFTPDGGIIEKTLDLNDSSKIDEAMEIIENAAGKQVLVFSTFNEPLFEIQNRCREIINENGVGLRCEVLNSATDKYAGEYEEGIQQGTIDVLCMNSAMGEGMNLQRNPEYWPAGASIGIFIDLWWSPARNEQCEARIVRPGSNEPCTIYVLKNEQSVDAFIDEKLADKKESFDSIMTSKEVRPASDWKNYLQGLI